MEQSPTAALGSVQIFIPCMGFTEKCLHTDHVAR
jgi:hypothetical protein